MTPRAEDRVVTPSPHDLKKIIVPCGELVQLEDDNELKKCTLAYNEYIVYNVNQILMRYAMRIKFHFQ